jgi:hypothetical protein
MFAPSIKLDKNQLYYIYQFKHVFNKASGLTNVPWQLLAGIWTRESFSVASPKTPGGPMQFDPPLSFSQITSLLHKYTNLTTIDIEKYARKGANDFPIAVICAACFLLEKMNGKPIRTDADIMTAAWRYNGAVGHNPTNSPYVYNGFDAEHNGMRLIGTIPDGHGGRKKVDIVDHRPGAFTVYTQLVTENI